MNRENASILKVLDDIIYQKSYQKADLTSDLANEANTFDFVKGFLFSESNKIRSTAAIALLCLNPERTQTLFFSWMPEMPTDVRVSLLDALCSAAYPRDRNSLFSDEKLRENVDLFFELLNDDSAEVRSSAAYILGNIGGTRAVEPLIEMLKDNDDGVRHSAAQSLGWLADGRALTPLIDMLDDAPRSYFGTVVAALGELGQIDAVPALVALLIRDLDWFALCETVQVLEQFGCRPTILALTAESVIAKAYDKCLSLMQNHEATQAHTQRDIDSMRSEAAKAVGMLGGDEAVAELIVLLHDRSLLVRRSAVTGLSHTQSIKARSELEKLVKEQDVVIARDAFEALNSMTINLGLIWWVSGQR